MGWNFLYNPLKGLKVAKRKGRGQKKDPRISKNSVPFKGEERVSNTFQQKKCSLGDEIPILSNNWIKRYAALENERVTFKKTSDIKLR